MTLQEQSRTHLDLLSSSKAGHVFQVIPEHPDSREDPRTRSGTFDDLSAWLLESQRRGCAAFVQVNEGTSARSSRIKRARAFFLDIDDRAVRDLPYEPTLVVKTGKGSHVYYSLMPTTELKDYERMERGLAKAMKADLGSTRLNQKARLAGSYHLKSGKRVPVEIVSFRDDLCYTLDNFEQFLEVVPEVPIAGVDYKAYAGIWDFPLLREVLRKYLSELHSARRGNRFLALRRASYQLGRFVSVGLDVGLVRRNMRKFVEAWATVPVDPYPVDKGYQTIEAGLKDGFANARTNPPYCPPEQVAKFEMAEARLEILEQIKRFLSGLDPSAKIIASDLLEGFPDWEKAFEKKGSAVQAINKILVELGCESGRTKQARYFVIPQNLRRSL